MLSFIFDFFLSILEVSQGLKSKIYGFILTALCQRIQNLSIVVTPNYKIMNTPKWRFSNNNYDLGYVYIGCSLMDKGVWTMDKYKSPNLNRFNLLIIKIWPVWFRVASVEISSIITTRKFHQKIDDSLYKNWYGNKYSLYLFLYYIKIYVEYSKLRYIISSRGHEIEAFTIKKSNFKSNFKYISTNRACLTSSFYVDSWSSVTAF